MINKICVWCRGLGKVGLKGHDPILCPNCKGSGRGSDGGQKNVTGLKRPYMLGNKFACLRKVKK